MKRIISILLLITMMLALSVSLAGCKQKIETGTEAAKLLLANERLDSRVLGKIDLGLDGTKVVNLSSGTPVRPLSKSDYMRLSDGLEYNHTWTEFPNHSHSMVEFTDGAVATIAQKALDYGTGARALRAVMENIMLDVMYELPDKKSKKSINVVIDEDKVLKSLKSFPFFLSFKVSLSSFGKF